MLVAIPIPVGRLARSGMAPSRPSANARGIFFSPATSLVEEIARVDTAMQTLMREINDAVARCDAATKNGSDTIRLQADFLGVKVRWDNWRASEQTDAWLLSARSTLDSFESEYGDDRKRFIALGNRTSTPEPPKPDEPSNPINKFASAAGTALAGLATIIVVGAVAYVALKH